MVATKINRRLEGRMDFTTIAEGLRFPEGPVVMPDGSVILVEIERGTITRVWGEGKTEVVATPGGGPNGAAIGPDGSLYVCNNGGFEWTDMNGILLPGHAPHDYSGGRVERVDLSTGKVERLFDSVAGIPLRGPNDLVFDAHGGFYFSDHGKSYPRQRDYGGLFYCAADGTTTELVHGMTSPNGVGLSPDGKTVYMADTMTGRLFAYEVEGPGNIKRESPLFPGRCVVTMPGLQYFDSLAVEADGRVCVATLVNGGITSIHPVDGTFEQMSFPDLLVTNIAFGGADMMDAYITLSGTGLLVKARWPRPGLRLNH
jgi:gluconolactonase